jgi:energy-coupling factor transporter ATP-binding protein EcfA2
MNVLVMDQAEFSYPGGPAVITGVSMECSEGESVLLLGDNGSGKSTFGRIVGGLLAPTAGRVLIDGTDLATVPVRRRPARAIYVSQVSYLQFFGATVADEMALAARQAGRPLPDPAVIDAFALPPLDSNPRDLNYPQMWRLQLLLLGVIFRPRVLFIDEMVAPALPEQQRVLAYTLADRRARGECTWLSYQRPVGVPFDRVFSITDAVLTTSVPG